MKKDINTTELFCEYYRQWIDVYKKGAIREATMAKYLMTQKWVERLVPELKVSELTRTAYQKLLNDYAKEHERQTTLDFHHQLKGAILDAVDEGLIKRDPTRKAIIKGKTPRVKKIKYLNQFELHTLIAHSYEIYDIISGGEAVQDFVTEKPASEINCLADYIEENVKCEKCGKKLDLVRNAKDRCYLKGKECSHVEYLTPDEVNNYIVKYQRLCPIHHCPITSGLSKDGVYVRCEQGHFMKPDEI